MNPTSELFWLGAVPVFAFLLIYAHICQQRINEIYDNREDESP